MASTNKMISFAIGITFSLIIVGILLPIGLTEFLGANWTGTGLDSAIITMITVLVPICIILGIVLLFLPKLRGNELGGD